MADREDSKGDDEAGSAEKTAQVDWVDVDSSLRAALALLFASDYTDRCDDLCAARRIIQRALADFTAFCGDLERANLARAVQGGAQ